MSISRKEKSNNENMIDKVENLNAEAELKKGYAEAEALLQDEDKMERY